MTKEERKIHIPKLQTINLINKETVLKKRRGLPVLPVIMRKVKTKMIMMFGFLFSFILFSLKLP